MELKDLISKLSSYNLFTNLLPGILFVTLLKEVTSFNLVIDPIFLGVFLYYFIGIVINRIGSLIIEPVLKKAKFLRFIEYSKFIKASKIDAKIEILSENNNMCRSLVALCISLFLAVIYEWLAKKIAFIDAHGNVILIGLLLVVFLFSYRKQTKYIVKRCNANLDEK